MTFKPRYCSYLVKIFFKNITYTQNILIKEATYI